MPVSLDELMTALRGAHDLLGPDQQRPRCPSCQRPSPPSASFCAGCGGRLRYDCPRCSGACRVGEAHCSGCGLALSKEVVSTTLAALAARDEALAGDPLRLFETTESRGASARVARYVARRRGDDTRRFLKASKNQAGRALLRNEARALRGFEHEHVIRLHATHDHQARVLLEFEHVKSESLRFPLAIPDLIQLMLGVARGVAAVHARGWLHGDLKPANILVRAGDRTPLLVDFESAQTPGPSRFGAYTPMFAAPEQVFGDHIDARADVYAFGVTLYLLFIYDRVPSLLDPETAAQQAMQQVLGAKVRRVANHLENQTIYGGVSKKKLASWMHEVQQAQVEGTPGAASNEAEALGAKYFFSAELERLTTINRRLDLTGELLALVGEATEIEPTRRPKDGAALVQRMEALDRRAREEVGA